MVRNIFDKSLLQITSTGVRTSIALQNQMNVSPLHAYANLVLKSVVIFIPLSLLHVRKRYKIDESYVLLNVFQDFGVDSNFWMEFGKIHDTFDHICNCIGTPEADESTMATAYGCKLSVQIHIYDMPLVSENYKKELNTMFLRK